MNAGKLVLLAVLFGSASAQAGANFYRMAAIHELQMKSHLIYSGRDFNPGWTRNTNGIQARRQGPPAERFARTFAGSLLTI